jgi:hypothetical protein
VNATYAFAASSGASLTARRLLGRPTDLGLGVSSPCGRRLLLARLRGRPLP